MAAPGDVTSDYLQRQLPRRLNQIAAMVLVGMGATAAIYGARGSRVVIVSLGLGMVAMVACLALNRTGRYQTAVAVLLTAMTASMSGLIWTSEGLRDVALLAYPVILVVAGMLGRRAHFFGVLAAMLAFLAVVALGTYVWHWRSDGPPGRGLDLWRDASLVMVVGGVAVWLIIEDMQRTLGRLREQIGKYGESQARLAYLAQHDGLTGLPNRSLGRELIEQAIETERRLGGHVALLFVDLDRFKAVNDSLGHQAGDDLLNAVAARLKSSVRRADIVARHGGDEFIVGLSGLARADDAASVASTVLARLAGPLVLQDTEVTCTGSIGIAVFPDDGDDVETLIKRADIAMYRAKEAGRNTFCYFDKAMQAGAEHSLMMVSGLRGALARSEFVLHYQPVVSLATRRVHGAEALIRWQRPGHGLVPPGVFIGAAEASGLIVEIGRWVLREACAQLARWQASGHAGLTMAVNLSVVQFRRGDVHELIRDALQFTGAPPEGLEIEITESTLAQDSEVFMTSLRSLKAMGVRISIDDFGTGYSNLSYLQRFEVDRLKIDRSFVQRLSSHSVQDRAIVHAIIQMAHSLGLAATAEGVEEEAMAAELLHLGCGDAQGYFFGRPEPPEQFALRLAAAGGDQLGAVSAPTAAR